MYPEKNSTNLSYSLGYLSTKYSGARGNSLHSSCIYVERVQCHGLNV